MNPRNIEVKYQEVKYLVIVGADMAIIDIFPFNKLDFLADQDKEYLKNHEDFIKKIKEVIFSTKKTKKKKVR